MAASSARNPTPARALPFRSCCRCIAKGRMNH